MVRVTILTEGQPPRYANITNTPFQAVQDILSDTKNPRSLRLLLETGDTLILSQHQLDRTIFLIKEIPT